MRDDPKTPGGEAGAKPAPGPEENRQERLAAALRANLRRRKAQARERAAGETDAAQDGERNG